MISRLQARLLAVTLLGQVEGALRAQDYGPATATAVAELRELEARYGLALFDGLPGLLDRYSNALLAWRELRP